MKRRTLLAAVCAGTVSTTSGCLDGLGTADDEPTETDADNDDGTEEPTPEPVNCPSLSDGDATDNEPGEGFPRVEVRSGTPELDDVQLATEVVRHFDETDPARLEVTFMNDGDETKRFAFGPIQPLSNLLAFHTDDDAGRLFLKPTEGTGYEYHGDIPGEPTDGCWVLPDDETVFTEDLPTEPQLDPCETLSMTYDLYYDGSKPEDADEDHECPRGGEYRVEAETVGDYGHDWELTITVEHE